MFLSGRSSTFSALQRDDWSSVYIMCRGFRPLTSQRPAAPDADAAQEPEGVEVTALDVKEGCDITSQR